MIAFSMRALAGTGALTIALSGPGAGAFAAASVPANDSGAADKVARTLDPQTRADLEKVMKSEAFTNASYLLYAKQARREGLASVARLFQRTAGVERNKHFRKEAELYGLVGSDSANLQDAISGETHESEEMYPGFARQAEAEGEENAADVFSEIAGDEGEHAKAFRKALDVVKSGQGSVPAPPEVESVRVTAGPPHVKGQQTMKNLLATSMHGEAFASAKYRLYGKNAKDPAVERLFLGIGQAERREHFAEEAQLVGFVGTTRANLTSAIAGERYAQTMYPDLAKKAKAVGDTEAAELFDRNAEDEAGHYQAFQQALNKLS